MSDTGRFAALAVRLCLDIEPGRFSSQRYSETMIAQHMQVVYNIPSHKEYIKSGYSSEPILTEAAATIWNNKDSEIDAIDSLKALSEVTKDCMMAKGNLGQLAARFILLRVYDIASLSAPNSTRFPDSSTFSNPVPLWTFFDSLFATNSLNNLATAQAMNRSGGDTLKQACKNKFVRFTHFALAEDSSVVSTAAGWKAFTRANAWQCYPRQEAVDIIIPVIMCNNDSKLGDTKIGREQSLSS